MPSGLVARAELAWAPHVEVREGNVLDVDWAEVSESCGGPLTIYGNLPYHLSSPIVFSLLESPRSWKRACFLLQRELRVPTFNLKKYLLTQ